jgi:hypothetical protein
MKSEENKVTNNNDYSYFIEIDLNPENPHMTLKYKQNDWKEYSEIS